LFYHAKKSDEEEIYILIILTIVLSEKTKLLTLREIIVRMKRTAATTRIFSRLRVKQRTFSMALFIRKLHLK